MKLKIKEILKIKIEMNGNENKVKELNKFLKRINEGEREN